MSSLLIMSRIIESKWDEKYEWNIFLLLHICLLYGITSTTSCIIYSYHVCIIIVSITASFILPLTRSLSDDPGFACPDLEIRGTVVSGSTLESHRRFLSGTIHRYLEHLVLLSYLFPFIISVMIADLFLQVFLYCFHAGPHVYMEGMYCIEA